MSYLVARISAQHFLIVQVFLDVPENYLLKQNVYTMLSYIKPTFIIFKNYTYHQLAIYKKAIFINIRTSFIFE